MKRLRLELKLAFSMFAAAAAGLAVAACLLPFLLEPAGFVSSVAVQHVQAVYVHLFPIAAAFILGPLLMEELSPDTAVWLRSLPLYYAQLLLKRWVLAMGFAAALYFGGLVAIDRLLLAIPWTAFVPATVPPILFLGHLALLGSIGGRSYLIGLALPLFYWLCEQLTAGMLTGRMYLFLAASPEHPALAGNREALLAASGLAFLAGMMLFARRGGRQM